MKMADRSSPQWLRLIPNNSAAANYGMTVIVRVVLCRLSILNDRKYFCLYLLYLLYLFVVGKFVLEFICKGRSVSRKLFFLTQFIQSYTIFWTWLFWTCFIQSYSIFLNTTYSEVHNFFNMIYSKLHDIFIELSWHDVLLHDTLSLRKMNPRCMSFFQWFLFIRNY